MKRCVMHGVGMCCLSLVTWVLGGSVAVAGHGSWGSSGGWYGGSSGGWYGSHGSSGGWYGGSSGGFGSHGSSGGWYGGSSGGFGSHGSSGGWYGGSSGGFGSHGSSGGYYGGGGYHNGGYYGGGGYVRNSVSTPLYASSRSARYYAAENPNVARLIVRVPSDAKVYLQDQPMSLSGRVRRFVSPTLKTGTEYTYTVRVEIERDGQTLSKTTDARVRAGDNIEVAVSFDEENPEQLVSSVTPQQVR